jgi:RimJ/RimL family protein N-acetyltransferase
MITLRAVEQADGDALHAIFTEPGVRRYLFDDILLTRAETHRHVEAACRHGAWVVLRDGEIIGLTSLRATGDGRELMIAIGERHWGGGIAF